MGLVPCAEQLALNSAADFRGFTQATRNPADDVIVPSDLQDHQQPTGLLARVVQLAKKG
jgi:hypothetical protein